MWQEDQWKERNVALGTTIAKVESWEKCGMGPLGIKECGLRNHSCKYRETGEMWHEDQWN
jgi:hypothetical protein